MLHEENLRFIKEKNKFYTFIWLFLLFELAVFFSLLYFYLIPEIPKTNLQYESDFNTIFLYLSYLAVIIAIPLAYKIYAVKKKQADKLTNLKQISDKYFLTLLIIYSVFEFAALLTLISFYINKMYEPLYMFGIVFTAVLLNKPSLKRFMQKIMKEEESQGISAEEEKTEQKQSENKIEEK
ncbi:MAG: hypothetical protein L3J56_06450 [Bacteroidales bacterium]|nr:hypothetical protein [Bacteroidales bacterium]